MKIVLDTNCLLISIPRESEFSWLWQGFKRGGFALCYTTEILNEYFEILSQFYSVSLAENVIDAILNAPHAEPVTVHYNWRLITSDPDNNKFVDCALNAGADQYCYKRQAFQCIEPYRFPKD